MSQENVNVVTGLVAAAKRGDWDAVMESFDPAVELDQSRMPDGGIHRGPSGMWKFYERWFGSWEEFRFESKGIVEASDGRVVSLVRLSGRGKGSGVQVTMDSADVYTLRDCKIVQMTGYPDAGEALEAVGLSEEAAHADS